MRITDLLKSESIELGAAPASKQAAIDQLADLMEAGGNLVDKAQYKKDVLAREQEGTTGLGDGLATPHAKSAGVKAAGLAAMTVPQGCDYDSMDGKPSRLFFMIAAPEGANDEHLTILQKLATMIMDDDFKEALIAAKTKDEFLSIIDQKEDGKFVGKGAATVASTADHIQILAVTACPTGIAHTFMAAESLEQHAKKRGISIKVETNGSGGAKNVLTSAEIAKADGIIISSPTGSTAYSLAAGGPILMPDSRSLVITPICPHALTSRPLVVCDSCRLSVRLRARPGAEMLEVFADGASLGPLTEGAELVVEKASVGVPLVELVGYDPYEVLNRKLGWSGSAIR